METIKVICPATVDKDVQKIKEELKKRWANCWRSAFRALERKFSPHFVVDAVNAYLQKGKVSDDPEILDLVQRIDYWLKLNAEVEIKKKARSARRGRLTPTQKARRKM